MKQNYTQNLMKLKQRERKWESGDTGLALATWVPGVPVPMQGVCILDRLAPVCKLFAQQLVTLPL